MLPSKLINEEDNDELERRLESDPRFLRRVAESCQQFREGKGIRMEDIDWGEGDTEETGNRAVPSGGGS